jgi:cytochrome c-550 PedF
VQLGIQLAQVVLKPTQGNPMPTFLRYSQPLRALSLVLAAACATAITCVVMAHGNVTPQAVDTHTLPQLGSDWLTDNPYSTGSAQQEAVRVGSSGFNQNIAPDLRKLDVECLDMQEASRANCIKDFEAYFIKTVRGGRTRDGRVYMPPFEGILSQEALWAIKTYLESRRDAS